MRWASSLVAASLALALGAAGPGDGLRGRRGCVLVADLRAGGRYVESSAGLHRKAFPPGSVFKVATALALAREGRPGRSLCTGRYRDRGRTLRCVQEDGHGPVGLEGALARSCNFYFRERGAVDREAVLAAGLELGLVRAEALDALRSAPMEDLVVGLHPGLALTPEEMLEAAAGWAVRGAHGTWGAGGADPARREGRAWGRVRRGLEACVSWGSCMAAGLPGLSAAGKTGTPVVPGGSGRTQGWFVGWAPASSPTVAVVVFLERGRGADAAGVARETLSWYFRRSP